MEYLGYEVVKIPDQWMGARRDCFFAVKDGKHFYEDLPDGGRRVSWPTLDALVEAMDEASDDYDPEWLARECELDEEDES